MFCESWLTAAATPSLGSTKQLAVNVDFVCQLPFHFILRLCFFFADVTAEALVWNGVVVKPSEVVYDPAVFKRTSAGESGEEQGEEPETEEVETAEVELDQAEAPVEKPVEVVP